MTEKSPVITDERIQVYLNHLKEQERSPATLQKYCHNLRLLLHAVPESGLTKSVLIEWKQSLTDHYAPASVNAILASLNGYLRYHGWHALAVRPLRIQHSLFAEEQKELTRAEYTRLVQTAQKKKNKRLALVLQTICATGIRVSELRFITAEAVRQGKALVSNKGKQRIVFLSGKLRKLLKEYLKQCSRTSGSVFTTRSGRPLDRSNIWKEMKALCTDAKVAAEKVFPHNLRHLFARIFYTQERDLSRLADILGHSNVSTTRIYTAESGAVHARQMEQLGLIIT